MILELISINAILENLFHLGRCGCVEEADMDEIIDHSGD